jgi:hypothetical protein
MSDFQWYRLRYVRGVGKRRFLLLKTHYGSVLEVLDAARLGQLKKLPGFGPAVEMNIVAQSEEILRGIEADDNERTMRQKS